MDNERQRIYQSRGGVYQTVPVRHGNRPLAERILIDQIRDHLELDEKFILGVTLESVDHIWRIVVITQLEKDYLLLGFDADDQTGVTTIGSIRRLEKSSQISLDGEGACFVVADPKDPAQSQCLYQPVSLQGLWSLHSTVLRLICRSTAISTAKHQRRREISSPRHLRNRWEFDADLWSKRPDRTTPTSTSTSEQCQERYCSLPCNDSHCHSIKLSIRAQLQHIMSRIDLETATAKQIHEAIKDHFDIPLRKYKKYIDGEMLTVMGEMENSSQIEEFLFLGSEWNAANRSELSVNGITHILNITKEIDNFYPAEFNYKNILLYDVPESDLLQHWDETFKFIIGAKEQGGRILIHCKMGISRSASTVCAFLMKYKSWSLKRTLRHVKEKRPIADPNDGFLAQLITYEGILRAANNRDNFGYAEEDEEKTEIESDLDIEHDIRVKRLVHMIHRHERNSIRKSKTKQTSQSAKSRPISRQISHLNVLQSPPVDESDQSESLNIVESDSFSPLHDTSYSDLFIEKSSDEMEMKSFHQLSDAGLVRRRTRNFEARLRRTNKPRKKKNDKTCQMGCLSAGSDVAINVPEKLLSEPSYTCRYNHHQHIYQTV